MSVESEGTMQTVEFTQDQKNLIRRYLTWCYKTTKEDFDRVERYFTQALVDDHMLSTLKGSPVYQDPENQTYVKQVEEFESYMQKKTSNANSKKFSDQDKETLHPEYVYLKERLKAIEEAAKHFLSEEGFQELVDAYEKEMTQRILSAREHI